MSFELKNRIKLSGYCDKSQRDKPSGMIEGPTKRMDVIYQEQNFVKKTF